MISSDDTSCSDCKMEIIHNKWTAILIKWLNKCVHPEKPVDKLSPTCLADIMDKYKKDICDNDIDRAILCTDDIEPFIKYKYPILRLRYLSEDGDYEKKQYIMVSVLLFHCCVKSQTGVVHEDIFKHMNKYEQEIILKVCERLGDMEITINNVDCAVKEAFDYVKYIQNISNDDMEASTSNAHANIASDTNKYFDGTMPEGTGSAETQKDKNKPQTLKFNSSVTVLPSAITDTSTYSSLVSAENSSSDASQSSNSTTTTTFGFSESEEMRVYPIGRKSQEFAEEKVHKKPYHRETPRGSVVYKGHQEEISQEAHKVIANNDTMKHVINEENILDSDGSGSSEEYRKRLESLEKKCLELSRRKRELAKRRQEYGIEEPMTALEGANDTRRQEFGPTTVKKLAETKDETGANDADVKQESKTKQAETKKKVEKKLKAGKKKGEKKLEVLKKNGGKKKPVLEAKLGKEGVHLNSSAETKHVVNKDSDEALNTMIVNDLNGCSCSNCLMKTASKPFCNIKDKKTLCGDPDCSVNVAKEKMKKSAKKGIKDYLPKSIDELKEKSKEAWKKRKIHILIGLGIFLGLILLIIIIASVGGKSEPKSEDVYPSRRYVRFVSTHSPYQQKHTWMCKNKICQISYNEIDNNTQSDSIYSSLSRCSLLCMGPQLWPYPIGYTHFSKKLVALATNRLEYKFQSLPSEAVHQFLAEAFKLFISDLARLERITDDESPKNFSDDLTVKKIFIQIDVEIDPEPRLKINTEESYHLKIDTINNRIEVKISSASFCGVRHGLQTLSQMILLDQTSGKLITISNAVIKDAPTYRYRGLMIDTARNYIPVGDLLRTIDAMATVKLNTFHWRISDVTSFPLYLPTLPMLFEYGGYTRSMVYTKDDIKFLVERAGIRGVRILIEIAAPGPVGRAWSWNPEATCPSTSENFTCDNILCLRLELRDSIMAILQTIYTEILEMTNVNDIFHLSDGVFSLTNCYSLIEDRKGYLNLALNHLKMANKGILPKLPIVWQTPHLHVDYEAKTWEKFGVQLTEMPNDPADSILSKFKVIHSTKWDLSCEIKKQRCTRYRLVVFCRLCQI